MLKNLFDLRDENAFHNRRISHQSLFISSSIKNEIKIPGKIQFPLLEPNNICWIDVSAQEHESRFVHYNHPFSPDDAAPSTERKCGIDGIWRDTADAANINGSDDRKKSLHIVWIIFCVTPPLL